MKTSLLPLVGIVLGMVSAFDIFAILFTTPTVELFPKLLFPFGLLAVTSFALSWLEQTKWKMLGASLALPTLLMIALMVIGLYMESRSDWSWALVAMATLCACIVPSWTAHRLKTRPPNFLLLSIDNNAKM